MDSNSVSFEIAALFPWPYRREKNEAITKQTYLLTPSSLYYIVLALMMVVVPLDKNSFDAFKEDLIQS